MVHSLWGRSKPVYLQKFPDRQLCEHLEEVLVPREEIITQDITVLTQKENKRVFYNCISQHNQTRKVIRSEQSFREDNSVIEALALPPLQNGALFGCLDIRLIKKRNSLYSDY